MTFRYIRFIFVDGAIEQCEYVFRNLNSYHLKYLHTRIYIWIHIYFLVSSCRIIKFITKYVKLDIDNEGSHVHKLRLDLIRLYALKHMFMYVHSSIFVTNISKDVNYLIYIIIFEKFCLVK